MSTPEQPSEEELRAAYEAQLKQLRVEDVVLQTIVSFINLGGRKVGLAGPGTEDEVDIAQAGLAIDGARALLPLIEEQLGPDAAQLRNAVSQLQMAFVQQGGQPAPDEPAPGQPAPGQPAPGPAAGSGRLWTPGS